MKGAIIGDVVGSIYEFNNIKTKDFPLFSDSCTFTDDTVMTVAVGMAFLKAWETDGDLLKTLGRTMHDYGREYPGRGYGGGFRRWLDSDRPRPYNSYGNGAPMRCSAAGWLASTPEKAFELGMYTAAPTHNHPEGMKAAGVTAMLIWHARHGMPLPQLRETAEKWYAVPSLDELRPDFPFDESSQGTMPAALAALFESRDFEDAVRNAVSLGGDSDTIAAITGSVAEAVYGVPDAIWARTEELLQPELRLDVEKFCSFVKAHAN